MKLNPYNDKLRERCLNIQEGDNLIVVKRDMGSLNKSFRQLSVIVRSALVMIGGTKCYKVTVDTESRGILVIKLKQTT